MSTTKKILRIGVKTAIGIACPAVAPSLVAGEMLRLAKDATLGKDDNSIAGKALKGSASLFKDI